MKNSAFKFQDPGEGIDEAEVVDILVSVGDSVSEGQQVIVVETDKAAFELASPRDGVVEEIPVDTGDTIHVGDPLLHFESKSETEPESEPETESESRSATGAETGNEEATEPAPKKKAAAPEHVPPVPATPATRRLARELGVDISSLTPSDEHGRVVDADVRAAAEGTQAEKETQEAKPAKEPEEPAKQPESRGPVETEPLRSVRRATAKRMARAWAQIPHVTHQDSIDITDLERWRRRMLDRVAVDGGTLSLTVLVVKALTATLREYPRFNATLDAENETLRIARYYDIGIAVDTDRGLLVPVVRNADAKSISELSTELVELAERARDGQATRQELSGSTFTLTNVGSIGGTGFTPIINHPEVAILGLGRARLQTVVRGGLDDHETDVRLMLPVQLAFDHRVVDGADAARFVRRLAERLSNVDEFVLST